jgi:hypothetical protein
MKTITKTTYSLVFALLLTSVYSFSNNEKGKYKKTKTISKEYIVDADNTVDIDNKYGDITITTWDKKGVSIIVTITVESRDEERVEKKLNDISVAFSQDATHVFAETHIKSRSNWSFISIGNRSSINYSIDYEIKMPVSNNVNLDNDYGSIFIDKLDGRCEINCDYGGIHLGELHNKYNKINMDYGHQSNIDFINEGNINTDYSKLIIDKANKIKVKADYSNLIIYNVDKLRYYNDYGSLKIKKAQEIEGSGDYLTLRVIELDSYINVNCDYGSIKINYVNKGFNTIKIDAEYSGIKVGFAPDCNFDFKTITSYADVKFESLDAHFIHKEVKMFSKTYIGSINGGNTNSQLIINSSYGGIKLYKSEK